MVIRKYWILIKSNGIEVVYMKKAIRKFNTVAGNYLVIDYELLFKFFPIFTLNLKSNFINKFPSFHIENLIFF